MAGLDRPGGQAKGITMAVEWCDRLKIRDAYADAARWPGMLLQFRLSLSAAKPWQGDDLSPRKRLRGLIEQFNRHSQTFHQHRREFRSVNGLPVKAEGGKLFGQSWTIASYEATRKTLLSCVWFFERRNRKQNRNPQIRTAVDSIKEYEHPAGYVPDPDGFGFDGSPYWADSSPYLIFDTVLPGLEQIPGPDPEDVASVVDLSGCREFFDNVFQSLGIDACAAEVMAGVEAEWNAWTSGANPATTAGMDPAGTAKASAVGESAGHGTGDDQKPKGTRVRRCEERDRQFWEWSKTKGLKPSQIRDRWNRLHEGDPDNQIPEGDNGCNRVKSALNRMEKRLAKEAQQVL